MTYQEQSDRYRSPKARERYEVCIREQAHLTFASSADAANKALADAVIMSDTKSIDALMAAICVGPNSAVLEVDGDLLSAVQTAWPVTAQAFVAVAD